MPLLSDYNVEGWFVRRGLPWYEDMSNQLSVDDIEFVEEIDPLPAKSFHGLFAGDTHTIQTKAKRTYKELCKEEFDFAQCITRTFLSNQKKAKPHQPVPAQRVRRAHKSFKMAISLTISHKKNDSLTLTQRPKTKQEKMDEQAEREH